MTARRVTAAHAARLGDQLSTRDWAILGSLATARVLSGSQLTRLHFHDLSPHTQDRVRRRVLERLTELDAVARLGRTVGGIRAGSSGWVHALGVAGQRLVDINESSSETQRVRRAWTPSALFLKHSLAVAELFVRLVEHARSLAFTLTTFQTEPACWWPNGVGGFLKPDAFVTLSTERYDELTWLEIDCGTESLPAVRRKLGDYLDFVERGELGPRGVLPQVVITVEDKARQTALQEVVRHLGEVACDLFMVVSFDAATDRLAGQVLEPQNHPP